MTRKRDDKYSTQFGLWLREQKAIDSKLGFRATDLDYLWDNYLTGEWMLIEEKRRMHEITYPQREQFKKLHKAISDEKYKGFHLLQFEKESPEDGMIFLNKVEITKEELIKFLRFGND